MTTLINHLSNQVFHDFEIALENAQTDEEVEMWETRIEALEGTIEALQTAA